MKPTRGLLACAILLCAQSAFASFDNGDWGVRGQGMAGAFVAQANDASAPFWNPAGSAFFSRSQGSFMWERAYPGLTEIDVTSGFLSLIVPSRYGSFGGAVTSYSFGTLLSENIALFHYSRQFGSRLGLGINFKYLTHDYKLGADPSMASNPAFSNGTAAGGVTLDLGALYVLTDGVSAGFSGRNLTEPDVGLRSEDKIAAELQGGLALKASDRWTVEGDWQYKNLEEGGFRDRSTLLFGAEYDAWQSRQYAVLTRAGVNRDLGASQQRIFKSVTAGFSLLAGLQSAMTISVDYAFAVNINLADGYSAVNQAATHKLGISLLFGSPNKPHENAEKMRPASKKPLYNYTY